jgi:hypothetical protein
MGLCLGIAHGQNSKVDIKAEEAAIRALVAAEQRPPYATHHVFWSGALRRPVVDEAQPDPFPASGIGMRKNQKISAKIERLEVSASGDLAWEYSIGTLEYDLDDGSSKHEKFDTGTLRVWKKEGGSWKVAAAFVRPIDVPFADK